MSNTLWVEKYRPSSIETYVFRDDNQRRQVAGWKEDGALPHLLFSGAPGTGKTTLAKVLLQELDVDSMDILEINASNENSVDTIRSKITNFSSTMPFGDMKSVDTKPAATIASTAVVFARSAVLPLATALAIRPANLVVTGLVITCSFQEQVKQTPCSLR